MECRKIVKVCLAKISKNLGKGTMIYEIGTTSFKIYSKSSATGHENPGTTSSPVKVSS